MSDIFEHYYEPTRSETLLKRAKITLLGLLALSGCALVYKEGAPRYRQVMNQYEAKQERLVVQPSDEELVRRFINESKNRDPKTGEVRLVYKLSGALAVQQHKYEKDGIQPASLTNFVLVKLHNNRTYLYGENALVEPIIFRLDQTVICALHGDKVQLEEVELGHNLHGGIGLKDTGHFLPNDRDWRDKCQSFIPAEQIVISAEI